MKSLNSTDKLWTNRSAKDVDMSDYQAACCLNFRVTATVQQKVVPLIKIEDEEVTEEFLKTVLDRMEAAKKTPGQLEDINNR